MGSKAANSSDQHLLQEKNNKQLLHESIQADFIAQSQSLSNITRTIVGVILGTIWVICYKEREVDIPNGFLLASVIMSIVYFIVELRHYYIDTVFYHNKSDQIVESEGNFDLNKMASEVQKHSKRSFYYQKIYFGKEIGIQ